MEAAATATLMEELVEPNTGPPSSFTRRCEDLRGSMQVICRVLQDQGATRYHVEFVIDDESIAELAGFYPDPHARTAVYAIVPSVGEPFVLTSWPQLMASVVGERRRDVRWDFLCRDVLIAEAGFHGSTHEAYVDRWDPDLDEVHCWTAGSRSGKDLQAIEPVDSDKYRPILVAVQPSGDYRLYRGQRGRLHAGMQARRPRSPPPDAHRE